MGSSGLLGVDATSTNTFDDIASLLYAFDIAALTCNFPTTLRSGHSDVRSQHVFDLQSDAVLGLATIGSDGSCSVTCRVFVIVTVGGMRFKERSSLTLISSQWETRISSN